MSSLKEKFKTGVFWNLIDTVSIQLVSFIVSIVLARILNPADFGTIAIINTLISVFLIFTTSGLNEALIIKKDLSKETLSSVFLYNMGVSIVIYIIVFFLAPIIADFYSISELTIILRILMLTLVISSSNNVHLAILFSKINFQKMFFLKIPGLIISVVIGITLAFLKFGVWSLVWQTFSLCFINSLLLWIVMFDDFTPTFSFNMSTMKNLFSFSGKLMMSGVINKIFDGFFPLYIGKQYSAESLSFYNRGVTLKDLIVNNIVQVVAKVSLPVFSKLNHDKEKLKWAYKKVIQVTFFIITPLMFGGVVVASNLIYTVYSEKWILAVPFFRLACVLGFLYPFHYINLDILKVYSKSGLFLNLEIIKKALIVLAIIVTVKHGIIMIMVGQIVVSLLAVFLNAYFSGVLINYGIYEQIRDLIGNVLISLVMAIIVFFIGKLNFSIPIILIFQLLSGLLIYFLLSYFFKISAFMYLKTELIFKSKQ